VRLYVVRRLLAMVPTFLLVSIAAFSLIRILPGDAVDYLVTEFRYADTVAEMRHKMGLDRPFHTQYLDWIKGVLTGDLGQSLTKGDPVSQELAWRLPITLELAGLALLINLAIGIPVGIIAAVRQDTILDYVIRSGAILAIAIPSLWLGTMFVLLPAVWWGWTPPKLYVPFTEDPLRNLGFLILPAFVLGFEMQGRTARMLRATMLEVMRQDYIRTAWAKGLSERTLVYRHAAKNALIPVITLIGLEIPLLLGATVIIEQIFSVPGVGRYLLGILSARDYVPIQSLVLVLAAIVMLSNLLVDMAYSWLDPRIRFG
jgi:peptide/nickel transport system permease protein